ncbi:ATP-binding protein [Spirillospora sp. CA-294931]|uniref:ATP-binding protein n=1 Tax=Spirillospora sp. CA-294931 TaxID=3240042 RepID=UPI003D8E8D4C
MTQRLSGLGGSCVDVREVRAFVRDVLAKVAERVDLDDVDVMTSEVVTNAVRYSRSGKPGGGVYVSIKSAADRARVEVLDDGGGSSFPRIPEATGDSPESGRGLLLVEGLSERWGYEIAEPSSRRVTVWFEVGR